MNQEKKYIRTCQECGYEQVSIPPTEYTSDRWTETKCKKCKSISLNYGKWVYKTLDESEI